VYLIFKGNELKNLKEKLIIKKIDKKNQKNQKEKFVNPIKKYRKIVSLDFELYNSMFYWSICWAGVCAVSTSFKPLTRFDIKINPAIRHKFCGKDLTFPFTGAEIRREKLFGEVADRLLSHLTKDTLVLGHAFDNDARMIIDACAKYNVACPEFDYVDTNILYNALTGETGERSLAKLAEKYGIEFNAHDPLEDARATMEVAKAITDGDMLGFIKKHNIEPSRLENSLMYRGGLPIENTEQLEKHNRLNMPFIAGASQKTPNDLYYIDTAVLTRQDLMPVLLALVDKGHGFTSTPFSASIHITNNLCLDAPPDTVSLRALVYELGLDGTQFDFSPKRVRDARGKAITIEEYYKCAFCGFSKKGGKLDKKGVSFSKRVERSEHFENMLRAILSSGGRVCFEVGDSDYFIVLDKEELKQQGDQRLRTYRRYKKQQVFDLVEFSDFLS